MKKFITVSAILLTMTGQSFAGNVESFGIGARATALGGAFSATANDPYAAYYNPAGLTQIDSPMLSTGLSVMDPNLKAHKFTVEGSDGNPVFGPTGIADESDDLFVPHMGFAMPVNKQISIGMAAYVPYGLDVEWSPNTTKNPAAYNWFHSYYMREVVTPTVAYKVNDQFSIGLGVSLGKSKSGAERVVYYPTTATQAMTKGFIDQGMSSAAAAAKANAIMTMVGGTLPATKPPALAAIPDSTYQSLLLVQTTNSYNDSLMKAEMEDDFNYSFNIGFMYKPVNSVSLGLTYRSKADAEFDGPLKINNVKVANAELDYDHPDQIQAGVRYQPNDKVSMEADVVWTYWRHNEYQREYFKPYLIVPTVTEKTYDRDWNNTNQLRLGIEWKALDYMTVRAGYFYDPSPIPDDTFDIMWPDADRKTYSIGLGFNCGKNITIDTALQYAIAEAGRIIGGESGHNLNDTYNPLMKYGLDNGARDVTLEADGNLWGYSATMNYKF
ncbi:OmpP1/FadL family transporter [Desulforegula conservatrix]|uniref:OmpP1/FadL family transporter n=1 Tax=Desulforegula conservatrix TaxID=153026 RepID=UPI000404DE60|nr:outer membrane protein transport protein [Desulforegula conservatrix]